MSHSENYRYNEQRREAEGEVMPRNKSCTCEHYKANEPHEFTCEMNINQQTKPRENKTMHTPAPWKQFPNIGKDEIVIMANIDGLDFDIATVLRNKIANARLIAAAPELLEALNRALPYVEALSRVDAVIVKEAIAKAEGKG